MYFKDAVAHKRGFTIVELLVVIAVIGILATITLFGFSHFQMSTRDTERASKAAILAEALEKYYDNNGEYPGCLAVSGVDTATISKNVLLGVEARTYLTPTSVAGDTNSVKCMDITGIASDPDVFSYVGDGSIACNTGQACLTWTLKYKEEATGVAKVINSRRNTNIATSGNTILTATAFSSKQINLSWTSVDNATNYTLQTAADSAFTTNLVVSTVTGTTAVSTGLSADTTYYFRIMPNAVNSSGNWSNTAIAKTTNDYGSLAVATSIEGYWTVAPQGFLLEDGSAVSRATYADLFAVIGTYYGVGNGSTTFNVPDSRGRTAVNKSADVEFATIGQKSGSKAELLTIAQIPAHTHTQDAHAHGVSDPGHNHSQNPHTHGLNVVAGLAGGPWMQRDYRSDGEGGIYEQNTPTDNAWPTNYASTTGIGMYNTTATNQYTGGGSAHNNVQPSIVKTAAIKYTRIDVTAATLPAGTSIQGYWSSAPAGYTLENGAAVSRTNPTYADLFAAIGTTYGAGDGSTTFNVPNSQGRAGVNKSPSDTEFDTMGEKPGSKTESLTIAQIPSHTHIQDAHAHGIYDAGHNHAQAPHSHGQEISANSGGPSVRIDYDSGGESGVYSQGINAGMSTGTNNPSLTGVGVYNATATNQNTGGGGSHNNIQPSIVKLSAIKTVAATAATNQPIATGTSISGYWPSGTPPAGYLSEDGSAISRTTYASLFAAIGTTYGVGNGSTTFNVPDSRGRVAVNKNPSDAEFNTMGEKYGEKTHIITLAELASHTHIQDAHAHSIYDPGHNHTQNGHTHAEYVTNPLAGWPGIRNDYGSDGNGLYYSQFANTDTTLATNNISGTGISFNGATATNQYTGGNGAHNEIQPSIVKLFVIKY